MNILFLCDRNSAGEMRCALQDMLSAAGHTVQTIVLNREEIKPCIGCYGCWMKTPGQCIMTDDPTNSIAACEIRADAVVLLSEIVFGGFSADTKAFLDRSIQNILPFFELYKGEMHHAERYKTFPIWIAVGYGEVNNAETRTFIKLAERNSLNFRPRKHMALHIVNEDELPLASGAILNLLESEEVRHENRSN